MLHKKVALCLFLIPLFVIACVDEHPIIIVEPINLENFQGYGITFSESDHRKIDRIVSEYHYNCSTCHNVSVGIGPDLKDKRWTHGRTALEIFNVIYFGINEMSSRERPPRGPMPAFGGRMSSQQVWDIAVWLSGEYKDTK